MRRLLQWGPATALLGIVACDDLSTVPPAIPSHLQLDRTVVTVTEGADVEFTLTVLDENGEPMDVPSWAQPTWTVDAPQVLQARVRGVHATGPGSSIATARVAGLEATATVRVNPAQMQLQVAAVAITQTGNTRAHLLPGRAATVAAFLTGDKPNFFRPTVVVKVLRDGTLLYQTVVQRTAESVPQTYQSGDQSAAWIADIPASFIQPGVAIVVEADPEGTISRSSGSIDRFPQAGAHALDVRNPQLQLRIRGVHLTQSVQTLNGAVPLVAGRDALLRVFVTGDEASDLETAVRATFYSGATVVHQITIARHAAIPTQIDEGNLGASWNALIPAIRLTPGVSIVIEADPQARISQREGSEPRYPASGAATLDVRPVPTLWLRMIPIQQNAFGTVGTINSGNVASYLTALTSKFATSTTDVQLRSPYVTNARTDTGDGWSQLLSEINALRTADGSRRYYYGVLRPPPNSP